MLLVVVSLLLSAVEPSPSSAEPNIETPSRQTPPGQATPVTFAADPKVPSWSIGAGVSFGSVGLSSLGSGIALGGVGLSSSIGVSTLGTLSGPGATTFVERRLGARSFIVFDLAAAYQSGKYDQSSFGQARQRSISADLGLRYLVTPPGSVVDVSVLALLGGSLSDYATSAIPSTTGIAQGYAQWGVSASGGLAVERQLTPGVFVRISTPVVSASYGRTRLEGAESRDLSAFGVGLRLAPRLELRLAF